MVQEEEPRVDPYDLEELRDAEVTFDLLAFVRDHPIIVGITVLVIVIFFFWFMNRRKRR